MGTPRAIASATISFGLVSIPIKVYTAASSESARFNMLHEKCGNRVKQKLFCPTCKEDVERKGTMKGYEFAKNQYVQFSEKELKALDTDRTSTLDILEFVPLSSVDLIQVEKSYYLGPDKGGQKAYKLLSGSMDRTEKVAVGRYWTRGKEQLVLVRPYKEGLLMHQLYYADEVRDFGSVDVGDKVDFRPGEPDLADQLIEQLTSDSFRADKYRDEYRDRVMAAIDEKVAGREITVAEEAPAAQIIDLFDALKASLAGDGAAPAPASSGPKPVKKTEPASEAEATGTDDKKG
ncbi:MAG: Ku protein [Myxococcales bacterium]|nr:Ku protein [Myxococcales bacterium]